ncbi:LysR family transcriptional regulator [Pseudokordiimonas caeni]|uniref:LysR family transcriptional regulator n=1 Tax=Pseudokordiimonas caeni TaxID=2997908 RepID=UPI002811F8BD|nr:LysR family transcriptional regulator [Pseudokordiimonas caeni]
MFDWNDLRYFLEVARRGKMVAAAERLGVDHTTVGRRLQALEADLGVALFDRRNRTFILTEEGRRLLYHAEAMENAGHALVNTLDASRSTPTGTIRLSTPEAFGSQYLARRLMPFHQRYPGIELELVAETRHLSLTRREADAAVALSEPTIGRLNATELGQYRLRFYAAPSYLNSHPPIVRLADLAPHHFIWYVDDLLSVGELKLLDRSVSNPHVVFRSTSVTGQAMAAESGMGIALLPCFLADRIKGLTPVLKEDVSITRSLYFVVHPEIADHPRLTALAGFLRELVRADTAVLDGSG